MKKILTCLLILSVLLSSAQTKSNVFVNIQKLLIESYDLYYTARNAARYTISEQVFTDTMVKTSIRLNESEFVSIKQYTDIDWKKFVGYEKIELMRGKDKMRSDFELIEVRLNFSIPINCKEYTSLNESDIVTTTTKVIKIYISERFKNDLEVQFNNLKN